jgi:hypothetical protein
MNSSNQAKNTLVDLINAARNKKGIGINELGDKAGLPAGKASLLCSGKKGVPVVNFSLESIYKVLKTLDMLKRSKTDDEIEALQIYDKEDKYPALKFVRKTIMYSITNNISPETTYKNIISDLEKEIRYLEEAKYNPKGKKVVHLKPSSTK